MLRGVRFTVATDVSFETEADRKAPPGGAGAAGFRWKWLAVAVLLIGALGLAACGRHEGGSATGRWSWISGARVVDRPGNYGTRGTAGAGAMPGARQAPMSWTDEAGNLWLFGGIGYDTLGTFSYLNDLWKYSEKTGQWTWMSGAKQVNEAGHYGVHGVGAPRNTPGAR